MKTSTFSLLSRFTVAALVLAITWADTDTSQAQRSRGRSRGRSRDGLMDLARDRDIGAELKLTDEQAPPFPKGSKLWKDTGFQGCDPKASRPCSASKKTRGELTPEEKLAALLGDTP